MALKDWKREGLYWVNKKDHKIAWVFYGGKGKYFGLISKDDRHIPPYKRTEMPIKITREYKSRSYASKKLKEMI